VLNVHWAVLSGRLGLNVPGVKQSHAFQYSQLSFPAGNLIFAFNNLLHTTNFYLQVLFYNCVVFGLMLSYFDT